MKKRIEFTKDAFSNEEELIKLTEKACDMMEKIYEEGDYPKLTVKRSWSEHNPIITGEIAMPGAYRWYLKRELKKLAEKGAEINIFPSRPRLKPNDPSIFDNADEDEWDITQKKMFLFSPERIDISLDRLKHYTGTDPSDFQRYILFTNYDMHVEVFKKLFPGCIEPDRTVQMPAYHHKMSGNKGFSLVNIGVGPSNAKTISDHVAVLRPDAMVMVGHCGGLRNHQEIGDFVLATGFMRDDGVLDDTLPLNIPITPNHLLNVYLKEQLDQHKRNYRLGTVYTTANRNWEFMKRRTVEQIHVSRSVAIDMESATVATNGYRYRIPFATLLCVSDKPLHGKPKLSGAAQTFYQNSKEMHLKLVIDAIELSKRTYPEGLPNASIRAINEPLMGGAE
ncbi:AMP nucleosidase [Rhodohalobacter sp. SW132]|uniref:phosphorylase family protein n=1 Tax=Rhodohalobacter sp. SW132 TaxID=2293433 RepID=UPI000E282549|nr:AMP nucleosidase [Rhodohalobacter sp. SW132]REL38455.1 AMP nucleosidase [Rhodohalobacter sp. SW132]